MVHMFCFMFLQTVLYISRPYEAISQIFVVVTVDPLISMGGGMVALLSIMTALEDELAKLLIYI